MATRTWIGGSEAISQVTAWVFGGTWESNDIVKVTIGTHTISVVTGSTVAATIAATVATALAAATSPDFKEITWTSNSTSLIGTGTAGVPFTCTVSTTETGGGAADAQTIDGTTSSTGTDSTACSGPNFASVAANWSGATKPVNGDTVIFADTDIDCLYGLTDLAAVTTVTLKVYQSFTGNIGLAPMNGGDNGYREYRQRYLQFAGATLVSVGLGEGPGSQRMMFDFGSTVITVANVYNTGSPESGEEVALFILGTHANNVINVNKGYVGVGVYPGEASTVSTLRVGYRENLSGDSFVVCGSGLTGPATINQSGGRLRTESDGTTVNQTDGVHERLGTAVLTTLNLDGGQFLNRSSGTITTALVGSNGNLDHRQDMRAKTITNLSLYEGSEYHDPFGVVTVTNGFDFVRCSPDGKQVIWDVAPNLTWTPST